MKGRTLKPLDFSAKTEVGDVANEAQPARLRLTGAEPEPTAPAAAQPAVVTPKATARAKAPTATDTGWWIYLGAFAVSCLWAGAPLMYAWGYRREVIPFQNDAFAIAVFGLLALGPIALVWIAAYVMRQGARLAQEARENRALAEQWLQPAAIAAAEGRTAVDAIREVIESAAAAAAVAREELTALREALATETTRLNDAAETSTRSAAGLTQSLSREREQMNMLAGTLDAQASGVIDAVARQSKLVTDASDLAQAQLQEAQAALTARAADLTTGVSDVMAQQSKMVAEASDLAQAQLHEAQAVLAARTADLAAAAADTHDAARQAGETLALQVERLETAGAGVGDQVRAVEDGLTQQRAALVAVAHGLRADHEDLAAAIESRQAQLSELLARSTAGAATLEETAARGAQALRDLLAGAAEQAEEMAAAARAERDLFGAEALKSLGALSEAAGHQRQALLDRTRETVDTLTAAAEEAHRAAEAHAQAAKQKVDELGEAAFMAGQKADAAFEARLSEARSLIDQSSELVDEAGARAAARLDQGIVSARDHLAELERLLAELDARADRLPQAAEDRAAAVKATLDRGVDDLLASARKAAEETQAIDAAFQERVRRNYEMLSEAVRLMGVVAGAAGSRPAQNPPQSAAPTAPPRGEHLAPAITAPPEPKSPPLGEGDQAKPGGGGSPLAPADEDDALFEPSAHEGLRPRLRLTPTATDDEFKTVFDSAAGRTPSQPAPAAHESLTWKDLLSSIDENPIEDEQLADRMIADIESLGVDAAALLPRSRVEELAAIAGEDPRRAAVRSLAPAAVRRLSRRLFTDRAFRVHTDRYVRRYANLLSDAAARDPQGFMTVTLMGSDEGRAFLLLDAASADFG